MRFIEKALHWLIMGLVMGLGISLAAAADSGGVPVAAAVVPDLGKITKLIELAKWLYNNAMPFLGTFVAFCNAAIALCLLIPGDQPEKFLQSIVDLLAKFSRKGKDSGNG